MPTDTELSSFRIERIPVSNINYMNIYIRNRPNRERGKKLIIFSHGYLKADDNSKIMIPHEIENLSFYAREGHRVFGSLPNAINGITSETLHGGDMMYNYTLSHIEDSMVRENISVLSDNYIYSFRLIEYLKHNALENPIILQEAEKVFLYFSYLMYDHIQKYNIDIAVLEKPYFSDEDLYSIYDDRERDHIKRLNTVKSENIIEKVKKLGYKEASFLHCRNKEGTTASLPIITDSPEESSRKLQYLKDLKYNLEYKLFNDNDKEKNSSTYSLPDMFRKKEDKKFSSTYSLPTKVPAFYRAKKALKTIRNFLGNAALEVFGFLDGGGYSPSWNNGSEFGETSHYSGNDAFSERKMASMEEYQARKKKAIETGEVQKSAESEKMRGQSAMLTRIANEIVEVNLHERKIKKIVNEKSSIENGLKSPSTPHPAPEGMSEVDPIPDYTPAVPSAPERMPEVNPPPAYTPAVPLKVNRRSKAIST